MVILIRFFVFTKNIDTVKMRECGGGENFMSLLSLSKTRRVQKSLA